MLSCQSLSDVTETSEPSVQYFLLSSKTTTTTTTTPTTTTTQQQQQQQQQQQSITFPSSEQLGANRVIWRNNA